MRLCGCGSAPHMSLVQGGSGTISAFFFTDTPFPTMTTPFIEFTYSSTAQGIFGCFTSTFPCRWAFVLLLGQAYRLVQCHQLLLNTNQFPSCQEHPVSPELGQRAGIEPALMDRWDSIPTRQYLVCHACGWSLIHLCCF